MEVKNDFRRPAVYSPRDNSLLELLFALFA